MLYPRSLFAVFLFGVIFYSCEYHTQQPDNHPPQLTVDSSLSLSYSQTKQLISTKRKQLAARYSRVTGDEKRKLENEITDFWISGISSRLYNHWQGTPWDFNGTTLTPGEGKIACGFFVASMLQDMGLSIQRTKLSVCAASEMMRMLVPHQAIKKLNNPDYNSFCQSLQQLGKGVYIIGLDFHVGIIVIDSHHSWFIHSNYINKQGVTKELVENSAALNASQTKWLVCLTSDKYFIERWLNVAGE